MVHLTAVLVSLVAAGAGVAADNPAACIALHCPVQSVQCVAQPACRAALQVLCAVWAEWVTINCMV